MHKIKVALSFLLYTTSCIGLLIAPMYISMALSAYSAEFVGSHGPRVPAFSDTALSLMPHASAICFSVLGMSVLSAVVVYRKAGSPESRLYWLGVLSNINFYAAFFLFGMVLVGFFLLPKVANGI